MDIEKQVCSFELSKQLKTLGIKQDSLFWWKGTSTKANIVYNRVGVTTGKNHIICSAFTTSELGFLLPPFDIDYYQFGEYWYCRYRKNKIDKTIPNKNEVNARAEMLIYITKNKMV